MGWANVVQEVCGRLGRLAGAKRSSSGASNAETASREQQEDCKEDLYKVGIALKVEKLAAHAASSTFTTILSLRRSQMVKMVTWPVAM